MARPCSTCEHPDRAGIELQLANGVSLRVIGKRYTLDASQLSRHRSNHMDDALIGRLRTRGARSDEELAKIRDVESKNLLDHLAWQRGRLYANADRCKAIGDDLGERQAMQAAGRVSESIAKLLGDMPTGTTNITNNLVMLPDYHRLRTALVRHCRGIPEAHAPVMAALSEFEKFQAPAIEHAA